MKIEIMFFKIALTLMDFNSTIGVYHGNLFLIVVFYHLKKKNVSNKKIFLIQNGSF